MLLQFYVQKFWSAFGHIATTIWAGFLHKLPFFILKKSSYWQEQNSNIYCS